MPSLSQSRQSRGNPSGGGSTGSTPSQGATGDARVQQTEQAFAALKKYLIARTPKGEKAILPSPPQRDLYACAMYLHAELSKRRVPYYFCGGFACINVGMTARTTSDIDIAVPNGAQGYGVLLDIFSRPPFIQDKDGVLPKDAYYFFVESTGNFVEVDGILAGFMAFPKLDVAKVVKAGPQMQLNFLEPSSLLKLKLSSWANKSRRQGPKKTGDISDIVSIRDLLIANGQAMDLKGLQSDMAKGLKEWVGEHNDLRIWQQLDKKYKG